MAEYNEIDLVQGINTNLNFVKNIAVEQADKCAGAIRSVLEYAVKLFWLKKYDKKPVWVKGYSEAFDLHQAIIDERFAKNFNDIVIGDMHIIRKTCNAVIHDNAPLTLEDAQELLIRLEKCVKAIEKAIPMKIIRTPIQKIEESIIAIADEQKPDPIAKDNQVKKEAKVNFATENRYLLSDFKDYLIQCGYAEYTPRGLPSTVYDYVGRIRKILEWESISLEELNCEINTICNEYDIGGSKQKLGELSHRAVINALKRYREFLLTNYKGFHNNKSYYV